MRLGIVSNARSTRNKRGLGPVEALLRDRPDVLHRLFDGSRTMTELLRELAGAGVTLLAINGGDGTIQAALTSLLEDRPFAALPPVALVPGGMANMTAQDVGIRQRGAAGIGRLLAAMQTGGIDAAVVERHVLRVDGIDGRPAQRGMFFGAAGIYDVIDFCVSRIHKLGFKGEAAHAATMAWLLGNGALRGLEAVGIHGHDVGIAFAGEPLRQTRQLIVLATTLDRLVLGSRPFWNDADGDLRFTTIAHPASGLLRHARQLLFGGAVRRLPPGMADSRGLDRVELTLDTPFTIDGEFFAVRPGGRLELTAPERVRFVRL
ncbi:MAG: diacylglycerol kinase family protein [Geminicoccaceae bacterium]